MCLTIFLRILDEHILGHFNWSRRTKGQRQYLLFGVVPEYFFSQFTFNLPSKKKDDYLRDQSDIMTRQGIHFWMENQ